MKILKDNTLGLVIDMQERLFPVMDNKENLLNNCSKLLAGLNVHNLPVLVTQQYTKSITPNTSG